MNRSLKLSVLIALALGTSQAMAMDLGQIQVKSALGQPLLAEIPLHSDNPAELQNLSVQLASTEEFARAGIVGGRTSIPLHFSVANAGGTHPVIRITSSTPVDDPFLDLLLEVNGKAGKSVREYAILLDPPNAAAKAPVAATPAPVRSAPHPKAPVAMAPKATAPAARPAAPVAGNGQLGPVERGQTLSGIAREVAPSGVDVQQMMLALKQANPDAFYRDNINALKSGAVLRVPTSAEAQAMTIAAAAAEVRRQNSDWRAGVPGKPTIVADAATRASSSDASTAAVGNGDRLALVPARQGSGAGTQGTGAGDKSSASLRQDLLRSQESLASLQQQSSDLKTRLKDLSDINSKNERLLSLKDNEIAELQAKLAAARKSAGMPAVAASAAKVAAAPAPAAAAPAARTELEATHAGTTMTPPATATPALASTAASAPVSSATTVTTPLADSAAVKPVEPVKPPVTRPVAPRPAPTPAPVEEQPWYMQTWAWAAGAAAVALLVLLAMLGRRRKPAAAAAAKSSTSLADRFGAVPGAAEQDLLGDDVDQEELLDQLAEHPDDIGLHLELVTLYYSRRDVDHFEAAAEAMHAHITDPQQDEWQDVLHMGEDLVPGHPLFDHHEASTTHDEADAHGEFNIDDYADASDAPTVVSSMPPLPGAGPKKVSEYNFNFDLTHPAATPPARPEAAPEDVTVVAPRAPTAPAEPASDWNFEEAERAPASHDDDRDLGDFNDDPVDTKLDLARAYVDMGDAEGARAMLGEVMKEGSQMQRDVAKRLLDSLH
ncbi:MULTISPECIES: FimV/HubP family polar landmark protein [Rhodanobacter]|uniref:FimV N-terminal domain-containing protein n=2 Tax=Rhodanobacter TaxID=75309 RepID=I4W670_9GAMM|nr:FimV/HubP family polar landmark protein [Rhodanobacter spathiphylli]EIL94961.1 FimV N-terminal domain-containing protein [Rhodanobacter spathiphylli B39]